jgi:hypothetical protein
MTIQLMTGDNLNVRPLSIHSARTITDVLDDCSQE